MRIVVVEDDSTVRRLIVQTISRKTPYEIVAEASDGLVALQEVRRLSPDVVIMDVDMPEVNGIEATRTIAQELPSTRVVGFSSAGGDARARMLEAGATSHFDKDELTKLLGVLKSIEADIEAS